MSGTPATRPAPPPAAVPTVVDQGGEAVVRRFVTVLAVVVGGLCFLFSLGNVYQLAVDLQLWVWIRPLVAPAVDLSLVALVVGIRFLARRGVSGQELRRPRLFLLAVGLAAWALNTAGAVAEGDWGKAAFDSLAPGLLLGWAEVLPWFLRQFHAVTHPTVPVPSPWSRRRSRAGPAGQLPPRRPAQERPPPFPPRRPTGAGTAPAWRERAGRGPAQSPPPPWGSPATPRRSRRPPRPGAGVVSGTPIR